MKKIDKSLWTTFKNTLINPVHNMDNNVSKIGDAKNTCILAGIFSLAMMVLNLLTMMLSSIFTRKCDFWTGKCKTKIDFGALGNLDYVELVFKYLFMFALFAFGVAVIYYVVGLVLKKNANYIKILKITLIAMIPSILANLLVGPILGLIWNDLRLFINVLGTIYTLFILTFSLKNELKINSTDELIVYSVVSVTILYIMKYYVFVKLVLL